MKPSKRKKVVGQSGRGTVALIAILLVTSALLRVASGANVAFAQGADNLKIQPKEEAQAALMSPAQNTVKTGANRAEMGSLLVALQAREAKIKEREAQIDIRSKALAVVDEEIAKRLVALEKAEIELRSTLSLADGAAEDDLARLTSVYENMKPKDAAALFETMEPDFAAGFLGRMRPDSAASVLAGLTPAAAYSISVILASRNANVPKS
jgi:flagellar motility protein MotE (MotC chaperone)